MKAKLPIFRSENYNLLLVPGDHREVRRVRLTSRQIRFGLVVLLLAIGISLFNFIGFLHYRSLYLGFEKERAANREFAKERAKTLEKLKGLEGVVTSVEDYANRLAVLVGTERPELKRGIGSLEVDLEKQAGSITWKDLEAKTEGFAEKAKSLDLRVQELVSVQENKLLYVASKPAIWPVKGWLTSEFGSRRSPLTSAREFHSGIDIASQWGTSVVSPGAGVVTFAGYKGGLGRAVIIDHGYGIRSYYGHASSLLVQPGQIVRRGTAIAKVGNSGHSTGPHLHYEIHVDGVPVDPMRYILQ